MTTAPTLHLRVLAEAAEGDGEHIYTHPRDSNKWRENEAWHRAASPGAVLHLLDRIHALEMQALDLASENSILKRTETDELEARKPLPLSVDRLDELWASQRSFHGGEPLKMGHVEFARLIEVEYGVLGRIPMREENGGQIDHSLIARREVIADGPARITRLHLTEEGRAALTSNATGPLPGITGGSS
ncbi:hypothetical protein F3K36_02200 [Delftia sp. BR1]|nr:hypothetical protein F3K36_02200 [Delftia sp. BR1]